MDYQEKKRIEEAKKQWENRILNKVLPQFPERKEKFVTGSNQEVNRLYDPLDLEDFDYLADLSFPGDYPYTRGVQPTMYRGKLWTMRQYAGFGDAEESNKRYKYLLKNGQTGLSIAFDLPTQIGYDSDHPMSHGEVGKVGVAIDTLQDMEILFDGIPLDKVSTSMTINAPAAILLAMYIVVAEKQGISKTELNGTIQNDILKEYVARGTYIFPPLPSMRLITDIFDYCSQELPKWNTISISGYHIREAGATAIQEIAFTLANGIAYVDAAVKKGLDLDKFAPRLSFFFNAHNDLFEEIAKFRAARRLWAKIMKERFGAKDPKSMMLRFHTQTAGCTLTAQQPDNNIVRVAIQALAAVLGGTQSLHTNSRDEALSLPSQESVRIALRTQQIIAYESGITETVDPMAGSYYLEKMTKDMEKAAMDYIIQIDKLGGAPKAIEKGFIQREIQNSAYQYQKDIEDKKRIIVGVNQFRSEEEPMKDLLKVNPEIEKRQVRKLDEVKKKRKEKEVQEKLKLLREIASSEQNIMPPILDCVRSYATLGEICDQLRAVFGEYKESIKI
ncbi:MAG: methylmalonyl-CoA mutase family protein [Atribacterota bacterium]|nr:methylmalonyl-CoA mutase family protein [Atribacterota bacterium]MDD5496844.1 methylmalonyl-CoA mutase family protein [Atribacterota bacterium]